MSVIGFSSVMNTRRHMRNSGGGEKPDDDKSESGSGASWYTASESDKRMQAEREENERRKEAEWGEEWGNQPKDRKVELLTEKMVDYSGLSSVHWGEHLFSNSTLGGSESYVDKRKRLSREFRGRIASGEGYKDVKKLREVAKISPDDKDYVDLLIDRVRELDEKGGLTPRELRIAEKQRRKRGESGEGGSYSDVMERIGEKVMKVGEDSKEK